MVTSIDEFKKQIPGYNPDKAEEFHRQSAKMADKAFEKALKSSEFAKVIFVSGGSASGKTEFITSQLFDEDAIIFDSTLSSEKGAEIKLRKVQKVKKKIELVTVIPDDLNRAFIAFLNRDRKFDEQHFFKTHSGSRKTLLWIAHNYRDVRMKIVISHYAKKKLQYKEVDLNQNALNKFLETIQITEKEIKGLIYDNSQ